MPRVPTKTDADTKNKKKILEEARKKTLTYYYENQLLGDCSLTNTLNEDKYGNIMNLYVLTFIDKIMAESKDSSLRFDPKIYNLLEDKLNGGSKKKINKSAVKKIPVKKGMKKNANDSDSDSDSGSDSGSDDDKADDKADGKPVKKKNLIQFQKSAKSCLGFLVNRFTYEIFSTDDIDDNIKSLDNFYEFVSNNITDDFVFKLSSGVVVPAVQKLWDAVTGVNDYGLTALLNKEINFFNSSNENKRKYTIECIVTYLKIIALYIANMVYCKPLTINATVIESAVRLINISVIDSDNFLSGIPAGACELMVKYESEVNPKPVKKAKDSKTSTKDSDKKAKTPAKKEAKTPAKAPVKKANESDKKTKAPVKKADQIVDDSSESDESDSD